MNVNAAEQDPGRLGLYSGRVSTYVGYKLRTFIENLVARKKALDDDTTKTAEERFNIFVNDGSLPFGTALSPHNSHDNGKVLDIRPLGNFGTTEQHYDFNSGLRRRKDLALLWAESAYRFAHCKQHGEGSALRQTCEAGRSTEFISQYDGAIVFPEDRFESTSKRITDWININQNLSADFVAIPGNNLSIFFSDGITKYSQLCADMIADYKIGANGEPEPSICTYNVDGTNTSTDDPASLDRKFQILMLSLGQLPNFDQLPVEINTNTSKRILPIKPSEQGHFDHYHLKAGP